jgi:hypothetical protein
LSCDLDHSINNSLATARRAGDKAFFGFWAYGPVTFFTEHCVTVLQFTESQGNPGFLWHMSEAHSIGLGYSLSQDEHEAANSRATRCTITLAVYAPLQLGSVVMGIAILHKSAANSRNVIALADAPKLPIDITEAF